MTVLYGAIVPVPHLNLVKGRKFHLILAHMVQQSEMYREFYKQEARNGATIVLDNSSYELGDSWITPEGLIDIYNSLESKEVYLMCPEKAFDSTGTIDAVVNFITKLQCFSPSAKLFGTVHGTTYQNVVQCYKEVSKLVDYVGFSYRIWCDDLYVPYPNKTTERALMRINLIQKMVRDCYMEYGKPTHLLGVFDPLEIVEQSKHSFIKSCDSSTAFIHGKNKIVFRDRGLEGNERLEERLNFEEIIENPNLTEIIKHNIRRIDLYGTGKVKDL